MWKAWKTPAGVYTPFPHHYCYYCKNHCLEKLSEKVLTFRPQEAGAVEEAGSHMFYERSPAEKALYIILIGNRGLAGGYYSNICKKALEHMNRGVNEQLIVAGSRGHEFFRVREKNIVHSIVDVSDENVYYGSENLAQKAIELFSAGEADEVFVAYTRFDNVLTHVPVVERALPVIPGENTSDTAYEPDLNTFIDNLMPLYMHMYLFRAFSESHTSEQAAITQELNEIVGSVQMPDR